MVNKKGQMKIQQMAFMLIAITLFFVLVGLFILSTSFSGLKKTAAELEEKEAHLLVSKIANSPEFSCGSAYGGQKVNCVDLDKMVALMKNSETYKKFWNIKSLEVRKLYPVEEEIICDSQNYLECNVFKIYSTGSISGDKSSFVTLCRKEFLNGQSYDKCEIGKIFIGF
jgi:hypothetical protein